MPLLVNGSFPIGRGLSQDGTSEAKAIGRTKGAAIMKRIMRRRLGMRSKDGRRRVKIYGHEEKDCHKKQRD